jgi:hypothetical protein
MHVLETFADLPDVDCSLALGDLPLLLHLHEGAVGHGFEDQVDVGFVAEEAVEGGEVAVLQEGLDLDFPQQVLLHLHLADLPLQQLLQHNEETRLPVLGQVHVAK